MELCLEGDLLFLFLGGHGTNSNRKHYALSSHGGNIPSQIVIEIISNCKAEIYSITDSCYSG